MFLSYFKPFLAKFRLIRLFRFRLSSSYSSYISVFGNLKKDSIFVDLGANIGDVSSFVNDYTNGCKIFCYEPHPGAFNILQTRFENKKNINLFPNAVSNKSGTGTLFLHKESISELDIFKSQSSSLIKEKSDVSKSKKVKIRIIDISEILNNFDYIDCIKIDIEGSEYKIMDKLIDNQRKIGRVVCELHGRKLESGYNSHPLFNDKYDDLVKKLKDNKLYGSWFHEWH